MTAKAISGEIYVFRHGQTFDNKRKIFSGWRNSRLTPAGIANAKAMAKKLRNEHLDYGFSSHLSRMKRTMGEVLKPHKNAKMIIDNRIIERKYGKLQGVRHSTIEKVNKELFDKYHRSYDFPPPGGESIKMVEKRVFEFCKDIEKFIKEKKVNVAVVCGNNSMRALRRYFEKLTVKQEMALENNYTDYQKYIVK